MKVDKLSVSFPPDLGDAVRSAAERSATPVSTWLADAAAAKLRREALAELLDEWQRGHGAFTEGELAVARRQLDAVAAHP